MRRYGLKLSLDWPKWDAGGIRRVRKLFKVLWRRYEWKIVDTDWGSNGELATVTIETVSTETFLEMRFIEISRYARRSLGCHVIALTMVKNDPIPDVTKKFGVA